MAITRTDINGDFSALKAALDTLVPAFFASVELSGDTRKITCKDADDNTIFTVDRSSNNAVWYPTAYRSASSSLTPNNAVSYGQPFNYFYDMGANGAYITTNEGSAIAIAKASNGKTAIVMPAYSSGNSPTTNNSAVLAACWGDDTTFSAPCTFTDQTTPAIGNSCLMVPVPLYGSYATSVNIPKVYMLPVTQTNMRGILQEVTSDAGNFITNGFVAMLYDAGGTT